jgi:hypothetical protein
VGGPRQTLGVATALETIGTTIEFVLLDLQDAATENPALQEALDRCESDKERLELALEWFRDHPQPTERSEWVEGIVYGRPTATVETPTWTGPFPRFEDDELKGEPGRAATRPELPKGVNVYSHATIKQAVILLANGTTGNDVARVAKLEVQDATRVRNLVDAGLLRLNENGKLVANPRVARPGGRIVLRYLLGGRWLDPHRDPPPTAQGGSA